MDEEGWVGWRLEKRVQTTQDASFGPKVCFFIYLFRVLLILTNVFRSYSRFIMTGRIGLAGDEKNGPKRRQTCCLGPRCVFFFSSSCFCIITKIFYFILVLSMFAKYEEG